MRISSVIDIGRMQVNSRHQFFMKLSMQVVHIPSKIKIDMFNHIFSLISNQNELLSVPTHSILLPAQNTPNPMQSSVLSAWQIVSLDYSEWIDSVAYADLDGKSER